MAVLLVVLAIGFGFGVLGLALKLTVATVKSIFALIQSSFNAICRCVAALYDFLFVSFIGRIISGFVGGLIITFVSKDRTIQSAGVTMMYGALLLIGILWQGCLFNNDRNLLKAGKLPSRVLLGASICGIFFLGVFVIGIIDIHFNPMVDTYNYRFLLDDLLSVAGLSFLFVVKSIFGAFATMFSMILTMHTMMSSGELQWPDVIEPLTKWVVSYLPSELMEVFETAFTVYTAGVSLKDSLRERS